MAGDLLVGIALIALGFCFLWAITEPERNAFVRSLIWFCEHATRPRGRFMAWFWFLFLVFAGCTSIVSAFLG